MMKFERRVTFFVIADLAASSHRFDDTDFGIFAPHFDMIRIFAHILTDYVNLHH
jgi:hypothetical protein